MATRCSSPLESLTITSTLNLACGVIVTGPVTPTANGLTTPTAEITTSTGNISLFTSAGGCNSGAAFGLEYLHLNGAGPWFFDGNGTFSNIVFDYNYVTGLPTGQSCGGPGFSCQSIFFSPGTSYSSPAIYNKITIEHNQFGDTTSCPSSPNEDAGDCGAIDAGYGNATAYLLMTNLQVKYNYFYHLQEPIHFLPLKFVPGNNGSLCTSCQIEFNYFHQNHRINIEFQIGCCAPGGTAFNGSYNVFDDPLYGYYESYVISAAGFQWGYVLNTYSTVNPATYFESNLMLSPTPQASDCETTTGCGFIWGYEAWGTGAQYNYNMIQGNICSGVVWGWGASQSYSAQDIAQNGLDINHNILQGPIMQNGGCPNYGGGGGFIGGEPINYVNPAWDNPPCPAGSSSPCLPPAPNSIVGNVTGATPRSVTSVAPTISPASGSQTFPLTVTLTDPGYTSGSQPRGNTGIWYTTDGSMPVPGWGTAQYLASGGTFVLSAAATVKAVGMWGTPPQPTSYPAGYGFVPSAVKSARYTSGLASQQRRSSNSQYIPGLGPVGRHSSPEQNARSVFPPLLRSYPRRCSRSCSS